MLAHIHAENKLRAKLQAEIDADFQDALIVLHTILGIVEGVMQGQVLRPDCIPLLKDAVKVLCIGMIRYPALKEVLK